MIFEQAEGTRRKAQGNRSLNAIFVLSPMPDGLSDFADSESPKYVLVCPFRAGGRASLVL
jgi:hypothetical protein